MIRPLDLQMLYMNLEKVGKEQSLSKEASALAQSHQIEKLQREHDLEEHSVVRTNETSEPEADTKVDSEGKGPGQEPKREARPGEEEKEEKNESWSDPELGKHVDLSG